MSGKYVSQKATRGLNDPAPEVVRGKRVTLEAYAKQGALRNLQAQSMAYGKTDLLSDVPDYFNHAERRTVVMDIDDLTEVMSDIEQELRDIECDDEIVKSQIDDIADWIMRILNNI